MTTKTRPPAGKQPPYTEAEWQWLVTNYGSRIKANFTQQKWQKVIDLCCEFKRMCRDNSIAGGLGEPDNWPKFKNWFEDAQQKNGTPWNKVVGWDEL